MPHRAPSFGQPPRRGRAIPLSRLRLLLRFFFHLGIVGTCWRHCRVLVLPEANEVADALVTVSELIRRAVGQALTHNHRPRCTMHLMTCE